MAYFKTYSELVSYFEGLTATVDGLKTVTVGADEETLNQQNSRIQYPHLRVDTPEWRLANDDENTVARFNFTLFVLTNEPRNTNAAANAALSTTAALASKILKRLWTDADAGKFDIVTGDKTGDAIRKWSGDNDYGWWFGVTIDLYVDDCE